MLAENLVDLPYPQKLEDRTLQTNQSSHPEVPEENINTPNPGVQQIEGVPEAPQLEVETPGASPAPIDDPGELNDTFCTLEGFILFFSVLTISLCIDNMEVDGDYESSNEEPVSHFSFSLLGTRMSCMFFSCIRIQYLTLHDCYWYVHLCRKMMSKRSMKMKP
jgi:hypothetical protein